MTQENILETPHAWAKITKSSSKDGGIGYEFGYSNATCDTQQIGRKLAELRTVVLEIVEKLA